MNYVVFSVVALSIVVSSFYYINDKNKDIKLKVEQAEELSSASRTNNIVTPKLSSLVQNYNIDEKEKIQMNNLQRAINKAVLENNINNPDCQDLSNTGYITEEECNLIKDKVNNFAKVQKGYIVLDDNNTKSIILAKNRTFVASSSTQNNLIIKPVEKEVFKRVMIKKNKEAEKTKEINKEIALEKESDNLLDKVSRLAKTEQERIETQDNKDLDIVEESSKKLNGLEILLSANNRITQKEKAENIAITNIEEVDEIVLSNDYIKEKFDEDIALNDITTTTSKSIVINDDIDIETKIKEIEETYRGYLKF